MPLGRGSISSSLIPDTIDCKILKLTNIPLPFTGLSDKINNSSNPDIGSQCQVSSEGKNSWDNDRPALDVCFIQCTIKCLDNKDDLNTINGVKNQGLNITMV